MNRGAWQATVHEVTKSQTRLNNFHTFTSLSDFSICSPSLGSYHRPLHCSQHMPGMQSSSRARSSVFSRFLDVSLVPKQCLEHSCCCCLVAQLCMTLCDPKDCSRLLCPWNFPGKSAGVGCHFLLQEIFLTQGSNRHLLHWQVDSLSLSHQRSPPGTQCSVNIFCINQVKSFHQFPYQHCSLFCVPNRCCVLCLYHNS